MEAVARLSGQAGARLRIGIGLLGKAGRCEACPCERRAGIRADDTADESTPRVWRYSFLFERRVLTLCRRLCRGPETRPLSSTPHLCFVRHGVPTTDRETAHDSASHRDLPARILAMRNSTLDFSLLSILRNGPVGYGSCEILQTASDLSSTSHLFHPLQFYSPVLTHAMPFVQLESPLLAPTRFMRRVSCRRALLVCCAVHVQPR